MGKKKLKLSKMSNKQLMESALNLIESFGFHIKEREFGDTYFIFSGEKDSICHFHIKEIPGFKFAFWNINRLDTLEYQMKNGCTLWTDTYNISSKTELIFFTQYERDIDKFKPSRSGFVTGIYREVWEQENLDTHKVEKVEEWIAYDLKDILFYMKKHHIKSVAYSGSQARFIWDNDESYIQMLRDFIYEWIYHWKTELKEYLQLKRHIRLTKKIAKKDKTSYMFVIDRGEGWYPRIDLVVRRKPDVNLDLYCRDQIRLEKFEDKWWNKITIDVYDINIFADNIAEEDWEQDKQLSKQFKKRYKYLTRTASESDHKILYTNFKELK